MIEVVIDAILEEDVVVVVAQEKVTIKINHITTTITKL